MISGGDKAICKHCSKILSAKASHGTNSLNTHVKSCKGLQSQSIRSEGSQGTIRIGQFDKTHETNAKTELGNMIIMHEYPLSMVEHLGFKRYSKALQPSFKVPSRNTIKKEIMKIYEFKKEKTMKTAVEYKIVFPALKTRGYKDVPSEQDWNLVVEIAEKLQLFFKATELLSGTKYPTTNLLFLKICQIKLAISKWFQYDISEVVEMAKKMEEKFEKYWGVIGTIVVATILDPRYTLKLIEFYFKQVYPRRVALKVDRVKKFAHDLVKEYSSCAMSHASDNSSLIESTRPSDNDLGDDDIDAYDAFVSGSSKNTDKSDLERYLDETVLPTVNEFDVLYWWKTSGMKYPTLYKVARDILAILISTVTSESAFSTGGRIVSLHQNRLHLNTLEVLICGQDWLWSELRDTPSTLEDDIDADEESCHDSDVEFTPHQTNDTNTRRGRAARTCFSPLF
ncbi:hypothetical protein ACLB2K_063064 [Fragaria x ananassa]